MADIAKIFQSGNSQAVRLPRAFGFDVDEVEISREGDAVILRPRPDATRPWASLRAAVVGGFTEDFMAEDRGQPGEQERPDLDQAFE